MKEIEQNWNCFWGLNPHTKIVVLSSYVPKSLQGEEYQSLAQGIHLYNQKLQQLCQQYNVFYVDTDTLAQAYNTSKSNFHLNEIGHKKLASLLIEAICESLQTKSIIQSFAFEFSNAGLKGVLHDLELEAVKIEQPYCQSTDITKDYLDVVYVEQQNEKQLDAEICKTIVL